jgi:hypothetical protein
LAAGAPEPSMHRRSGAAKGQETAQAERPSQDNAKRKARLAEDKVAAQASTAETKASAAPADARQASAATSVQEAPKADAPAANGADSPERWLARIAVLRRQGSVAEAHVQLARFKQRYPDYPLPAELK